MFKQEDVLADLHTHSIMSLHAYNTIQEILDKTRIPYVAITDHVRDFNNFFLNSYIEDMWVKYSYDKRLIAGAEMDFNILLEKACFPREYTNLGILSYHDNGPFNVDLFIKQIDDVNPDIIGHPFRYLENRPEDVEKYKIVLDYAASKGKIVELNECSLEVLPTDFIQSLHCSFSLGSDSHELHSIGMFPKCIDFLNTYLPTAHVVNFDKGWLESIQQRERTKINFAVWGDVYENYKEKYKIL